MEQHLFFELINKYLSGKATREEQELLEEYYTRLDKNNPLKLTAQQEEALQQLMLQNIRMKMNHDPGIVPMNKRVNYFIRYAAAAAILIFCTVGTYLYLKPHKHVSALAQSTVKDIAPGSNKAVLTLNNGHQIVLNNAQNGNVALQGSTAIHKMDDGKVVYEAGKPDLINKETTKTVSFNTIATPRGGQYQARLPDGTNVWLNSASSIRFPTTFTGNERKVEITGEVYFEVAKDKSKPFSVTSAKQTVTVLGTHFNIMSYPDEGSTLTTLLEGSVRLTKGSISKTLKPGEQAQAAEDIKIINVDTDDAIAWKNGITSFTDADIKTIMRKVSRWYDVDVEYQGAITDRIFTGSISRKSNLSGLLKILALNHIQFSIEGRKLIVRQ